MEVEGQVEIHLKNASLRDIDAQAAELRSMYQVYRTLRSITRHPGDFSVDFEIREKGGGAAQASGLTREGLQTDAARFRILEGIKQHVITNVEDVQSFDLAFDLSCRRAPEEIEIPEVFAGGGPVG